MNYPVWYIPSVGGGLLIALIAILHVFISHFAVGGGLYLVLAERMGLRANSRAVLDFTKGHAKFFLLVTLVLGGMTGVGIWFIISLVQPAATSLLIHTFVFGWATEWVFFLVEIAAILIYYYTFDRMDPRSHQAVGWIYFVSAWLSLFIINGIIGFMLTPGAWVADGNFWSGFFNPTFWPALFFRTCIAFLFAGVYAFLTTAFLKDDVLRRTMTRYSGKWALVSFLLAIPFAYWYFSVLPDPVSRLVEGASPTIQRALLFGLGSIAVLFVLSLLLTIARPKVLSKPVAALVMASALLFMGAFEWIREAARRPYVIHGVMYSHGVLEKDLPGISRRGILSSARFAGMREIHEESLREAGEEIFKLHCYACHTIRGINNDIAARTAPMNYRALVSYIDQIHERRYFIPPFGGTEAEARALAAFIISGVHGKPVPGVEADRAADAARDTFEANCTLCHDTGLVKSRTAGWDRERIRKALDRLSALNPAMPDFQGSPAEKDRIADYIVSLQRGPAEPGEIQDAGEDLFEENCAMCHALRAGENALLPKIAGWDPERIRQALDRLETLRGGMPPLTATPGQKDLLAGFLAASREGGSR
jgi:mono/diheme cytochrome c family protein